MKKRGGLLVYKCRRCGELNKSMHSPEVDTTVIAALAGISCPPNSFVIEPTSTHTCKDGSIGVTDLIGGEFDA